MDVQITIDVLLRADRGPPGINHNFSAGWRGSVRLREDAANRKPPFGGCGGVAPVQQKRRNAQPRNWRARNGEGQALFGHFTACRNGP